MNKFGAVLFSEYLKVRRSKVFPGTMVAFSIAPVMAALFVIVLRDPVLSEGNQLLQSKAALTGFAVDWPSFLGIIAQAIGIGGLIVFGFVASWIFGREYSDKMTTDLLVFPVSRSTIVFAKLAVIVIWCLVLALWIFILALFLGVLLNLPDWSTESLAHSISTVSVVTVMVISLTTPATLVASVGRGYLAPLAFVVLTVVLGQIIGALGFGTRFPWAIPAIYSAIIGSRDILDIQSYVLVAATSLFGLIGTVLWWMYSDQRL